jgi:uncharacterized sulfatase
VPACLSEAGYVTAMFGKSHLKPCGQRGKSLESIPQSHDTEHFRNWHGPWYGFEHCEINVGHTVAAMSASMHYRAWLEDRGVEIDRFFGDGFEFFGTGRWDLPEELSPPYWAAERTVEYIRQHAANRSDQPFYVNLNIAEPHLPFYACDPYYSMYRDLEPDPPFRKWDEWKDKSSVYRHIIDGTINQQGWQASVRIPGVRVHPRQEEYAESYSPKEKEEIRLAYAMISLADTQIGRVMDCLDELGLTDNTLVLFTADHGDYSGDHHIWNKGCLHYEGCTRVPTIARWPGVIPAGSESDALFSNVDIAPTFLATAGLPAHAEMQGIDQTAALGDPSTHLRGGVLIDFRAEERLYANSWITDRYRLSGYTTPDGDEYELYDLRDDPEEFVNIAHNGQNRELVGRLLAEMETYGVSDRTDWQERLSFA